jgi:hypothetical protein
VKDLLARYRAMRHWVQRERRRLKRTGARPTQRYLRRARLVVEVDEVTFRELVRELTAGSL